MELQINTLPKGHSGPKSTKPHSVLVKGFTSKQDIVPSFGGKKIKLNRTAKHRYLQLVNRKGMSMNEACEKALVPIPIQEHRRLQSSLSGKRTCSDGSTPENRSKKSREH